MTWRLGGLGFQRIPISRHHDKQKLTRFRSHPPATEMSKIKENQDLNFDDFDDSDEFYSLRLASQLEFGELMCSAIEPALFAMKFKNLPTQQNQQRGATRGVKS